MIAREDSTSCAIQLNTESSSIGMTWNYSGNMPTPNWKFLPTSALSSSPRPIWTQLSIARRCLKFSLKSSKLLLLLLPYKAFFHCIIWFYFRFATGKSTGIVLDSGDGVTHVIPVYDGYSLAHSCERIDFGGRDVTEHLRNLLRKSGVNMDTSAEF